MVVADHLSTVGLYEHLHDSIKDMVGSPMLFKLLDAAREWIEGHPYSISGVPATISVQSTLSSETSSKKVCKFFANGNCKFGSECRNYHPDRKHSPSKQPCGETGSVQVIAASEDAAQSSHPSTDCAVLAGKENGSSQQNISQCSSKQSDSQCSSKQSDSQFSSKSHSSKDTKKQSMRTAADVISRILWDPDVNTEEFTIGYLDRFVGVIEKPFTAFSWEDLASVGIDVLAVPQHRIQYFKYREEVVWDKTIQLDNVFGSRGGKLIHEVVKAHAASSSPGNGKGAGVSESGQKLEGKAVSKARVNEDRPTHFICIRVTNEEIRSNVQHIQTNVISHSPHLADGCLPLTALHVSVCMVRLDTNSQIETAKTVLENANKHLVQFLPRCTELVFSGVDHFHNRLIYAKVLPDAGLTKFSSFLIERFRRAGLKTPGNHSKFTPHMTLVKMSRPMQHATHTNMIDHTAYSQFQDTHIGRQHIDGIHLCSMTESKQDDGFYKRFHFSSNSMLNLSHLILPVLAKYLHQLQQRGYVSEVQGAELTKATTAGADTVKFDQSITSIRKLIHDNNLISGVTGSTIKVVILRGLPGSGKSYLSKNCSEKNSLAVCSADDFFSKSGRYEFDRDLLPEAHLHCLEQFLQALQDGTELIVIDNTNSMLWEYRNYVSLCDVFGLQYHILEIPHPNQGTIDMYCTRNRHRVDKVSIKKFTERWEDDKRAMFVSPKLAYPQVGHSSEPSSTISLLNTCQPGYLPGRLLASSSDLLPFYVGIFLTPKSQWKLVTALTPTHPCVYADHVTLVFEPSMGTIASMDIGKKVTIIVKGLADSSTIQVATVDLPSGFACQNRYPHITISTDETTAPKYSNTLLESQPATALTDHIKLNGVIGIVVKEVSEASTELHTILSRKHFNSAVLPRLSTNISVELGEKTPENHDLPMTEAPHLPYTSQPKKVEDDVSICSGLQAVTELYIFDFDGTLFETPDLVTGKQYYEKCTGQKWPCRGWLSSPESLLPPLKIKPGPALVDYRRHCGRAGSFTVVLTARITRTEEAVRTVLEDHQVHPDLLILKPGDSKQHTPDFKVDCLASLLKQFPDVAVVKFWDDRSDNLEAVRVFSKRHRSNNIRFEINNSTTSPQVMSNSSAVGCYLRACGLLPTEEHVAAAHTGIHFIAAQFCATVGFQGDPRAITLVFGSHTLGRMGDVDLCLLAPPGLTHTDYIEKLAQQLEKCGVTHIHKGYSTRCPRLKVLLQYKDTPAIDYDIVFAICCSPEAFSACGTRPAAAMSHSEVEKLLSSSDCVSKTAFSGCALLGKMREAIRDFIPCNVFRAVVEMTVQVLRAQREKNNFYHYIRTFHIVLLWTDFIKRNVQTAKPECDSLFEEFISHTAQLSPQEWHRVFQDYVPVAPEYVPRFSAAVFEKLSMIIKQSDSPAINYEDMLMRPAFPPSGYTPVWLVCGGGDHVTKWRLQTLLEAKLPTFIQHLLSTGLDVALDGNGVQTSFCFAVQESESTQKTVQLVFKKFWNEFSEYRNRKDIQLEMKFSRTSELSNSSNDIAKEVEQFAASSKLTELHLPSSLSSYDRLLIHETAERLGLNHKTMTVGGKKHIYVSKS
jgi:2'-5' RNA ligase/predicted kinase/uncharacterized protein (UPF0248 family)